jgi:hypothetical protein
MLSMTKIDFCHHGKDGLIQRKFTLTGVELSTRLLGRERTSSDLSLISPWNIAASIERCNGRNQCKCQSHSVKLTADTLRARAAFSDMSVVVEVGMRLLRDVRSTTATSLASPVHGSQDSTVNQIQEDTSQIPMCYGITIDWTGLILDVIDDSGRHFAGEQDLIILCIRGIRLQRKEKRKVIAGSIQADPGISHSTTEFSTRLHLESVDIVDCLQSEVSPFRSVLAIKPDPSDFSSVSLRASPTVDDTATGGQQEDDEAGHAVTFWSETDKSKRYGANFNAISMQYNPSLVISLQRFLGRLAKDARKKKDQILIGTYGSPPLREAQHDSQSESKPDSVVSAQIDFSYVRLCLNKEHQRRRLLEITVTGSHFDLNRTEEGSCVSGHIDDLKADDPSQEDEVSGKVIHKGEHGERFVDFRYTKFARRRLKQDHFIDNVPAWVRDHTRSDHRIDDCLDLSVATVEIVYLKERTQELLDYLSNGMPGKGMGATSRAAKGFVSERFQKRSFMNIRVDAPKVLVPSDYSSCCLSLRLGKSLRVILLKTTLLNLHLVCLHYR